MKFSAFAFLAVSTWAATNNPTMPLVIIPPPRTNLYSLWLAWNPSPGTGIVAYMTYYGPASREYTNKQIFGNVTNALVRDLKRPGKSFFAVTAGDVNFMESDYSNELQFPPDQLPWTNTVVIDYPGTLLMAIGSEVPAEKLKFFTVTNRVFRLSPGTNYFWTGQGFTNALTITMTNNQVNYGKFYHKQ